jgi:hypothetical protein
MKFLAWCADVYGDHGTKILGQLIALGGLLNGGDAYMTQMLTMHEHAGVSFSMFVLGQLVFARGFSNSKRIAA